MVHRAQRAAHLVNVARTSQKSQLLQATGEQKDSPFILPYDSHCHLRALIKNIVLRECRWCAIGNDVGTQRHEVRASIYQLAPDAFNLVARDRAPVPAVETVWRIADEEIFIWRQQATSVRRRCVRCALMIAAAQKCPAGDNDCGFGEADFIACNSSNALQEAVAAASEGALCRFDRGDIEGADGDDCAARGRRRPAQIETDRQRGAVIVQHRLKLKHSGGA